MCTDIDFIDIMRWPRCVHNWWWLCWHFPCPGCVLIMKIVYNIPWLKSVPRVSTFYFDHSKVVMAGSCISPSISNLATYIVIGVLPFYNTYYRQALQNAGRAHSYHIWFSCPWYDTNKVIILLFIFCCSNCYLFFIIPTYSVMFPPIAIVMQVMRKAPNQINERDIFFFKFDSIKL